LLLLLLLTHLEAVVLVLARGLLLLLEAVQVIVLVGVVIGHLNRFRCGSFSPLF